MRHHLKIGCVLVHPDRNVLQCGSNQMHLEPKVMEVLCVLADAPNEVISRDSLLNLVWRDAYASDECLTRTVSMLRRAFRQLGCDGYIETVPKRGYLLTAAVATVATPEEGPLGPPSGWRAYLPWGNSRRTAAIFALSISLVAITSVLTVKLIGGF
ncbi:hypothetical protein DDZ18_04815 [Marinicauda salina]|uniref:OmpR/PhoB-type domain-containing protein n=1 Tax=Marinicauda salina TaxID=2135793 RepID=A0A2U2BV45_9PROT|nr:winged helix-turn-helix domain-containing protein [Marinicauda salina]PWE17901.1 hypothetical protein DDZ18_04815 [Marinicauda salina]